MIVCCSNYEINKLSRGLSHWGLPFLLISIILLILIVIVNYKKNFDAYTQYRKFLFGYVLIVFLVVSCVDIPCQLNNKSHRLFSNSMIMQFCILIFATFYIKFAKIAMFTSFVLFIILLYVMLYYSDYKKYGYLNGKYDLYFYQKNPEGIFCAGTVWFVIKDKKVLRCFEAIESTSFDYSSRTVTTHTTEYTEEGLKLFNLEFGVPKLNKEFSTDKLRSIRGDPHTKTSTSTVVGHKVTYSLYI